MRFLVFIFFIFFSGSAFAADLEREELTNYLRELNKIERLVEKAKSNRNINGQYQFKYELFESDLKKLKEGLRDYLEAPKRAPKVLTKKIKPLQGEYR